MSIPYSILPEALTIKNANELVLRLRQSIDIEKKSRINLSHVAFCDGAGIAALIEAKHYANKKSLDFFYESPSVSIREIAAFLKVDELLFASNDN